MVHDSVMFTKFMRPLSFFGRKLPFFAAALLTSLPAVALAQSADTTRTPSTISVTETHPGDYTVQDALIRLPGVQTGNHGQINLRGVGYNRYNVTLDGQRLSSTGQAGRSVDLNGLSMQGAYRLEWIRVLTPDMDADALGGTLNLRTHEDVVSGRRLQVRFGGGANPAYFRLTGPMGRGSIRYQEALRDDLWLSVNVHYEQDYRGREGVETQFSAFDFGQGNVDVIERVSPYVQTDAQERLGGSLHLGFRPSERAAYNARIFANRQTRQVVHHAAFWNSNRNWLIPQDPETAAFTTRVGNQGRYGYRLNNNATEVQHLGVHFTGENKFNAFTLDYALGWTQGLIIGNQHIFDFQTLAFPHTINFEDRSRPVATPVNVAPLMRDLRLQPMEFITDRHYDNRTSGKLNITVPLGNLTLKSGGSIFRNTKNANDEGSFAHFIYTSRTVQTLADFDENRVRSFDVLDKSYRLPWLADPDAAVNFFNSSIPAFATNDQVNRQLTDLYNYHAGEDIYAIYGMASYETGNLSLTAGIRLEQTDGNYEGRTVLFDRFNRFVASRDTSISSSRADLFPNLQAGYTPREGTYIQAAFSRSMHRHGYLMLAPFSLIAGNDTTLLRGNPDLKPILSDNIDLFIDQRINSSGKVSVGVFYKSISNYATLSQQNVTVREGDYSVFDYIFEENPNLTTITARETSYQNSQEEAGIFGFELGVSQRLDFLPGAFSRFGVHGNYTYSQSSLENNRPESVDLPQFSPSVINLALDYTGPRFFARLSYHKSDEYLARLEDSRVIAPSISATNPIYFDEYHQGWEDLSLSLQLRISANFVLWADAFNLLASEQTSYRQNRSLYPTATSARSGRGLLMGIQFNL